MNLFFTAITCFFPLSQAIHYKDFWSPLFSTVCWWSDFFSSCAWFERVIRQTSTNSAHCYSQLMCSNPSSSLCCPSLALETLSLDHSPRLNELWQPFLGICFSFARFLWSLASSPKSARESSFSHFLCAWDRQCCTVPQASGWSRTQELLRPTAEMLHSKRTETRDAVSKPLSATVSKTPLLSWVVTIY